MLRFFISLSNDLLLVKATHFLVYAYLLQFSRDEQKIPKSKVAVLGAYMLYMTAFFTIKVAATL